MRLRYHLSVLACIVIALFVAATPAAATTVSVMDLGTLHGLPVSAGNAINNLGMVVGYSQSVKYVGHAFVWTAATGMLDIGTLGGDDSYANAVNDDGVVVGTSQVASGAYHAFQWTAATGMEDLGAWGGEQSFANAVNSAGLIAGTVRYASGETDAVLWDHGAITLLPRLPGGTFATALGMNDLNQVVGLSDNGAYQDYPVLWENGVVTALPLLDGAQLYAAANDINNQGQVVGRQWIGGPFEVRSFLWTRDGGIVQLPSLGGSGEHAFSINDAGEIVGTATTADAFDHAVLWTAGGITDLGLPLDKTFSSPVRQSGAFSINEEGQVVGISGFANMGHAVLWNT